MKKVLIGVGAFVALVVILLTVLIVKDLNQEEKLRQELNEIDSLINFSNFDYDTVNERLGKTISNGDYLVVEKAAKKYLKDTIDIILEIADIMEDETLTSILTAQNYLEDGPNFINSKIYIKNTKEQLENYKTKVLKQYPFPDYIGEKFCSEGVVWTRIALKYKLRFFAEGIYVCEYLSDGLTHSKVKLYRNSPQYTMLVYRQGCTCKAYPLKWRVRYAINYWRYTLCYKGKRPQNLRLPLWANIFWFAGLLFYFLDSIQLRK